MQARFDERELGWEDVGLMTWEGILIGLVLVVLAGALMV